MRVARLKDGDRNAGPKHFTLGKHGDSLAPRYSENAATALSKSKREALGLEVHARAALALSSYPLSTGIFADMLARELYPDGPTEGQINSLRTSLLRAVRDGKGKYARLAKFVVPGTEGRHLEWCLPPETVEDLPQ